MRRCSRTPRRLDVAADTGPCSPRKRSGRDWPACWRLRLIASSAGRMGTIYLARGRRGICETGRDQSSNVGPHVRGLRVSGGAAKLRATRHPNCRLIERNEPRWFSVFVMEYATACRSRFCDATKLTSRRFQLFAKVCAAIHFAHQNCVHAISSPQHLITGTASKLPAFRHAKLLSPSGISLTTTQRTRFLPPLRFPEQIAGAVPTASESMR